MKRIVFTVLAFGLAQFILWIAQPAAADIFWWLRR